MVNNHLRYHEVSRDHLAKAEETLRLWRTLPIGTQFPQDADNLRFLKAISSIYNDCLISLTFSALFVEALANLFGEVYLGKAYFYEHLDKLDTKSKLQVVSRIIGGPEIDKSTKLWSDLVYMFRNRNEIVHHKTLPDDRWTWDPDAEHKKAKRCQDAAVAVADLVYNCKPVKLIGPFSRLTESAQQGDAPEPATNAHPALRPPFAPAR